ncbi:MAG TPA: sensor domain-containing diguanylate cyclase [Rhodopila sp.]|uniref:sensor domain-containing diguanylate cyclase n=1 Tax=Rhodopila sp. TaxID=2480087 RepID=UPI002CC9E4B8|nr:sensor domain-containing diguanylate cyclase [Rhodopila sp.]HVY14766.1 sensor domain-containing diguanylate cyclase [Rhodopila sp.]
MPDLMFDPPSVQSNDASGDAASSSLVHKALLDSRRRWRHLVALAADLAIETDAQGRIVFILPDIVLGWPAAALIGQPAELLLAEEGANAGFNPFRAIEEVRHRRCWMRRADGTLAMMAVSASPIATPPDQVPFGPTSSGQTAGVRVTAIDVNDLERPPSAISSRLRHGDVLDQVLSRVGQETEADKMMDVALWSMMQALDAEGAAVLAALSDDTGIELIHECGPGGLAIADLAAGMLAEDRAEPECATNPDGRKVLAVPCPSRFSATSRLAVWRSADGPAWRQEETHLAASATGVVRMILDYEAMLQRMVEQARTDPLTGLLNRRAFLEEVGRHLVRLDREAAPASLMFLDVDSFKSVNDRFGHAAGDSVLCILADILRRMVRPSDLVARLGGDEFAVWLSGTDHMTAAERADYLCKTAPLAFRHGMPRLGPDEHCGAGLSIGIATRAADSQETVHDLMRRADLAMYEVKRGGRGHWRVALLASTA